MSKSTPGPWRLHTLHYLEVCNFDSVPVAQCSCRQQNFNEEALAAEQLANARLIAAAPDLLAACKMAVAYEDAPDRHSHRGALAAMRAALAKAEPGERG